MPATTVPTPPAENTYGAPKAMHNRLPDGVYVPTLTFFTETEEVDALTLEIHLVRLIAAGVAGIVVHGSNGEVVHLTQEERAEVIRVAAETIRREHRDPSTAPMPLIAGCGAQSTRETLQLCRDAARAGASHALMLPPSYYNGLLDDNKVVGFFHDVADESPIPLVIYNFPGAASGRDLSSDAVLRIAQHPNVAGVKLTCGNTGKLARVAADAPEGFFVAGGSADFILQGMVVGAHGTISGLANIAPRACVRIMELFAAGRLAEARALQAVVAKGDWVAIRTGFAGVKAAVALFDQYGGVPRRPCTRPSTQDMKMIAEGLAELRKVELALAAGGNGL
ncbi:dihydrodipicolinate synthase [Plectosphaerella plurivora]|uniref:Dihydrodipicolinate synthase n=1 Tax=Plectosphaerella plurivora TaxID=936078 RepID=A0A9P8VFF3_9PEZI|nr:dihydrodipicolinate synthase [Plectosphaerella plurivora]